MSARRATLPAATHKSKKSVGVAIGLSVFCNSSAHPTERQSHEKTMTGSARSKPGCAESLEQLRGFAQRNAGNTRCSNKNRPIFFGDTTALHLPDMLTIDDLKRFAAVCGRCLTIFEPLPDDHSRFRKGDARLNAAIEEVDHILADNGCASAERDETLRVLRKRAGAQEIKGSLVVFRSRDFGHASVWPTPLPPLVHFGQQFFVLPLLSGIAAHHQYWLLTLAMKGVRLFRGSAEALTEVRLPYNVPKSFADAGGFHRDLEDHTDGGASGSSVHRIRLGASTQREDKGGHLHDFFRAIDRGIRPLLLNDRQPLILAGVTSELSLYGRVNTYSPILEQAIHGCPEHLTRDALHARASALSASYSAGAPDKALRDLDDAAGRDLLANDAEDIREAAELGRIEHLMIAPPLFPAEEEPLNAAVLATIRHSGRVSVLDPSRLPSGAAAILRFREAPVGAGRHEEAPFRESGR